MKAMLEGMSGMYDLTRVVDPIECRILEFHNDGRISMKDRCYSVWGASQRCANCSSATACLTGCQQEKAELFRDQVFNIQSNPVRLKLPDGSAYEAVVELITIDRDSDGKSANDREAENVGGKAAQYGALHDNLTKALNAGAFYELGREMMLNTPDRSWVMVTSNIKGFRLINAIFGVQKGNEALVKTGAMLRRIAEQSSGLCGRLGADQFGLLVPEPAYGEEALEKIAQMLALAFNSGVFTFHIHFGVYRIDDASIPVSVMCGRANTALHAIRDDMQKTVAYFDEAMLRKSIFEQQVISGFEEALRGEQFRLYLQPLVGDGGRVYGAEALVRWRKPDGTLIMPGDFIETLEQAGLIHELDKYIWEQAVKRLALWKQSPRANLSISVNMSAKDFYSLDVYSALTELTARYGVDNRMLRLEITETALLEDPDTGNAVVSRLRNAGFLVEIDDFGKGYSSLSLLKDIQADVLKIDMSLLREIESKPRSRVILESVINMAKALGMDVITEGVETPAQVRMLTDMGCHHFQGYYYSRPITVQAFEERY
jgi:EAL domain-containing protein (putative c-di-GMP-specific phosphodiesterase class I)